jgi:hypothetical protein
MPHEDNDRNDVGYGKPPRQTRFKKGQSGHPTGRPKGALNLATVLERALKEQVVVNEHGRRRTINKFEAALTQLVNKAASGDARAMKLLLNLVQVVEPRFEAHAASVKTLPEADRQVLARILGRLNRLAKGDHDHGDH